jgi:hypothetical protein
MRAGRDCRGTAPLGRCPPTCRGTAQSSVRDGPPSLCTSSSDGKEAALPDGGRCRALVVLISQSSGFHHVVALVESLLAWPLPAGQLRSQVRRARAEGRGTGRRAPTRAPDSCVRGGVLHPRTGDHDPSVRDSRWEGD